MARTITKIGNLRGEKGERGSRQVLSSADSSASSVLLSSLSSSDVLVGDSILFSDGNSAPVTAVSKDSVTVDLTHKVSIKGPAGVTLKVYTLEFHAFSVPAKGVYNMGAEASKAVDANGNHPNIQNIVFAMVRTIEHTSGYLFGAVTHPVVKGETDNGIYDVNVLNQTDEQKDFTDGYVMVDFFALE